MRPGEVEETLEKEDEVKHKKEEHLSCPQGGRCGRKSERKSGAQGIRGGVLRRKSNSWSKKGYGAKER